MMDIEEIDWGELKHAYGPADDFPEVLESFESDDPEEIAEAVDYLYSYLFHQGTLYSASGPSIPFLIELFDDENISCRREIVAAVALIAMATRDEQNSDHREVILNRLSEDADRLIQLLNEPSAAELHSFLLICLQESGFNTEGLRQSLNPALRKRADEIHKAWPDGIWKIWERAQ